MLFYKYAPLLTLMTLSLKVSMNDALNDNRATKSSSLFKFVPKRFLSMETAGAQKVNQQTVKKQITQGTNELETSRTFFRSPPALGAGTDERFAISAVDDLICEQDASMLNKVHMSYIQFGLLSDLTSDKLGTLDKFEKVKASAKQQIISSSADYQWSPTSAHAGGLLNDWTFNLDY